MPNLIPHFILEKYARRELNGVFEAATVSMDAAGFTGLTEALLYREKQVAEVLTEVLNRIFAPLVEHVYRRGGFVTNFAGDAFTALFPLDQPDAALQAVESALFFQHFFAENSQIDTPHGTFSLGVRVGLSAGKVCWGILGEAGYLAGYFSGQAVDSCKRGEQSARIGQIVADESILRLVENRITTTPLAGSASRALTGIRAGLPLPEKNPVKEIEDRALAPFIQRTVLDMLSGHVSGEFRQVAPVFINFDPSHPRSMSHFVPDLIRMAHNYGGYFNKLDFNDKGGAALVIFGAPVTRENDLTRAAEFLLELRNHHNDLPWKSGLTFGTAYSGLVGGRERSEYTVIGDVVNLSWRLMQNAAWGDMWVAGNAARLLKKRFSFDPAGEHLFRGFNSRRVVYALKSNYVNFELIDLYNNQLVGRERELERLHKFLRPVSRGHFAGIMTLVGDAGIGKTRLAHDFIQEWQASYPGNTPLWLPAFADEILRQSLNPFRYALRHYFAQEQVLSEADNRRRFDSKLDELIRATNQASLRTELERTRSFLAALIDLPSPGSLYDELDPKLRFENTLSGLTTLLCAESQRQPVIIQLEDVQYLDADSLRFLQRFSRVVSAENAMLCPLAFLATSRDANLDDLVDPSAPSYHMRLEPLPGDTIGSLVADILGQPVSPELVYLLAERSEGNPFFIEHLLDYLVSQNLLIPGHNGLRPISADISMPVDVRAALVSRLDRLPRDVQQFVQAAAVLGREFSLPVLAHILGDDPAFFEKAATAEREAIWYHIGGGRVLFSHALLRDAAYQLQLHSRRRELHAAALAAIEQMFAENLAPHYETLVYHADNAQLVDKQRRYYRQAGEAAQSAYLNALALNYYTRLEPLVETTEDEIEIHLKLAAVLENTGMTEAAQEHYHNALDLAERILAPEAIARCLFGLGVLARMRGQFAEGLAWLERARSRWELLGNSRELCRTLSEMSILLWRQGNYAGSEPYIQQSLSIAREINDKLLECSAINQMGTLCLYRADYENAREYYVEALGIAKQQKDRMLIARICNNLAIVIKDNDSQFNGPTLYESSLNLLKQIGNKEGETVTLSNLGWYLLGKGQHKEAREYFDQALPLYRALGDKWGMAVAYNNLGLTRLRERNYSLAWQLFEENVHQYRELKDRGGLANALNNLGLTEARLGNFDRAEKLFMESLKVRDRMDHKDGFILSMVGLGYVYACREQYDRAIGVMAVGHQDKAELESSYFEAFDQARAAIRAGLGEEEFERRWTECQARELQSVVEDVLNEKVNA